MGPCDARRLDHGGLRRLDRAAVGGAPGAAFYAETRPIGRAFGVPEDAAAGGLRGVRRVRGGDARARRAGPRVAVARELAGVVLHPPLAPLARRRSGGYRRPRTTGRCGRRSGCCRPASARSTGCRGGRASAPCRLAVAGWRAWRPLLPAGVPADAEGAPDRRARPTPAGTDRNRTADLHGRARGEPARRRRTWRTARAPKRVELTSATSVGIRRARTVPSVDAGNDGLRSARERRAACRVERWSSSGRRVDRRSRHVLAQRGPERGRAHPPPRRRRAGCRPGCRPSRSSRRRVRVDRPVERGRRAPAARVAGPAWTGPTKSAAASSANGSLAWSLPTSPVEPLVGRLVGGEVAQVRAATPVGIQMSPAIPCRTRRPTATTCERRYGYDAEPPLQDVEGVRRRVEHGRAGRARPVVDPDRRIAHDPRPRPVVRGRGDREVADVRGREHLGQAVGADRRSGRPSSRTRASRVVSIRDLAPSGSIGVSNGSPWFGRSNGRSAAHPRQPAIQVDHAVRPREQPVRARQAAAQRRAVADVDRVVPPTGEQTPPSGTMIVWSLITVAPTAAPSTRDRAEAHPAEPRGDRVELDPVDRGARRVRDVGGRVHARSCAVPHDSRSDAS